MASQKLLLMFIMNIFKNQKPTDIVNERIFFSRMEVNHVLIFSIETDGVFQFK